MQSKADMILQHITKHEFFSGMCKSMARIRIAVVIWLSQKVFLFFCDSITSSISRHQCSVVIFLYPLSTRTLFTERQWEEEKT